MERIEVTLERIDGSFAKIGVVLHVRDDSIFGHTATFEVLRHVHVHDSRPVHQSATLATRPLTISQSEMRFEVDLGNEPVFTYDGEHISVQLLTRLTLDDGWVWNTKLDQQHDLGLGLMAIEVPTDVSIVDPEDIFSLSDSFVALSWSGRARVLAIALVGMLIAIPLAILGLHDLVSSQPWFWGSDGATGGGILAVVVDGMVAIGGWALVKRELMRYCDLSVEWPTSVGMDTKVPIAQLVSGVSRVPLHGARLRVVACNMEKGQYIRDSGSSTTTISFSQPARTIVLYECAVDMLPAGMPLEQAFTGEVDFGNLFVTVLPPQVASSSHGLALHWEIQLIHDSYIDHDRIGPDDIFDFRDVWRV